MIQSKKISRNYIYIDDVINSIYKSIVTKNLKNSIIDIQGPSLVSLDQIIKILEKKLNKRKNVQELNPRNYSVRSIAINKNEKINLLFQSKITIDKGIDKILNEIN